MTAWAKISIILAALALAFGGGFYTKGRFDRADDANALQAAINARIDAEQKAQEVSSAYEAWKTQNQQTIATLLQKAKVAHAKNPNSACRIDVDSLSALRAAATSANSR